MTGVQLVRAALSAALDDQPAVHLLGEAVELSGATSGLLARHPDRVHLLPAADGTLVGVAVGMALAGCRPVVELSGAPALWGAIQQLGQEAAAFLGELRAPVVLRVPVGPGGFDPTELLLGAAGVAIASPGSPEDCGPLVRAALHHDGPVVLLEPRSVLSSAAESDGADCALGSARHIYAGDHATVLAWGEGVGAARAAAESLADEGILVDLFDLRSLRPLDGAAITASVARTGRAIAVGCGPGVLRAIVDGAFLRLESPPATSAAESAAIVGSVREALTW